MTDSPATGKPAIAPQSAVVIPSLRQKVLRALNLLESPAKPKQKLAMFDEAVTLLRELEKETL